MEKKTVLLHEEDNVLKVERIGPKKAELLSKLGIHTLSDALLTYPRDYEDHTAPASIADSSSAMRNGYSARVASMARNSTSSV